mmetsp:Transcript_7418/g.11173  ORF Transcript_7418/g.11173 Transcript_7418/m.11173 type:complete len:227 (-) Transcript_7418:481-1161(-)
MGCDDALNVESPAVKICHSAFSSVPLTPKSESHSDWSRQIWVGGKTMLSACLIKASSFTSSSSCLASKRAICAKMKRMLRALSSPKDAIDSSLKLFSRFSIAFLYQSTFLAFDTPFLKSREVNVGIKVSIKFHRLERCLSLLLFRKPATFFPSRWIPKKVSLRLLFNKSNVNSSFSQPENEDTALAMLKLYALLDMAECSSDCQIDGIGKYLQDSLSKLEFDEYRS